MFSDALELNQSQVKKRGICVYFVLKLPLEPPVIRNALNPGPGVNNCDFANYGSKTMLISTGRSSTIPADVTIRRGSFYTLIFRENL